MKIGIFFTVFLVFLTLKLTGAVAWSWWWITAPLWIPYAAASALVTLLAIIIAIGNSLKGVRHG